MPTVIAPFSLCEYLAVGGFPEPQGSGKRPLDRATPTGGRS